ncbi:hypothetical protein D3C78_1368640 [compost metagenome]
MSHAPEHPAQHPPAELQHPQHGGRIAGRRPGRARGLSRRRHFPLGARCGGRLRHRRRGIRLPVPVRHPHPRSPRAVDKNRSALPNARLRHLRPRPSDRADLPPFAADLGTLQPLALLPVQLHPAAGKRATGRLRLRPVGGAGGPARIHPAARSRRAGGDLARSRFPESPLQRSAPAHRPAGLRLRGATGRHPAGLRHRRMQLALAGGHRGTGPAQRRPADA